MVRLLCILQLFFIQSLQAKDCIKWTGSIDRSYLDEISGLVFSRKHQNVLYAHNDSGDLPRIFAIKPNGKFIAEFSVQGAEHIDWEDITVMECPGNEKESCIAVGDIGNNRYNRKKLVIYIVKEPTNILPSKNIKLPLYKKIEFELDTKEQNFEGLFSFKDELFLVSKMDQNAEQRYPGEEGKSIIYKLNTERKRAETIGKLDLLNTKEFYRINEEGNRELAVSRYFSWVTGADLSKDGKTLFLLSYGIIFKFNLGSGGILNPQFGTYELTSFPKQPQVESIAISEGDGPYIVSEFQHQPIFNLRCIR